MRRWETLHKMGSKKRYKQRWSGGECEMGEHLAEQRQGKVSEWAMHLGEAP